MSASGTVAPTAPAASAAPTGAGAGRVTQRRVIASEWLKLWTVRSTWITLLVALIGMVGIGLLIAYVTNQHWAHMNPGERATFSPIDRSMGGVYLAQLAIGVLGVLVVTAEYTTGMIRATLTAVPTRLPVLIAKAVVYALVTLVIMLVASFAAFEGAQALLGVHGVTLAAPGAVRAVTGVALYLTAVGLLAVGLGFLIRSTAGGIATLFGLLLVAPAIVHVLPQNWANAINPYLPSVAGSALFTTRPDAGSLAPWTGFGVFCAYAAAALVGAAVVLRRRDA